MCVRNGNDMDARRSIEESGGDPLYRQTIRDFSSEKIIQPRLFDAEYYGEEIGSFIVVKIGRKKYRKTPYGIVASQMKHFEETIKKLHIHH